MFRSEMRDEERAGQEKGDFRQATREIKDYQERRRKTQKGKNHQRTVERPDRRQGPKLAKGGEDAGVALKGN